MVGHKDVLAGLKVVTKASVLSIEPEAFHTGMKGESERSIMVIAAGVVEQGLREKVMNAFPGLLDSEEKERLSLRVGFEIHESRANLRIMSMDAAA